MKSIQELERALTTLESHGYVVVLTARNARLSVVATEGAGDAIRAHAQFDEIDSLVTQLRSSIRAIQSRKASNGSAAMARSSVGHMCCQP